MTELDSYRCIACSIEFHLIEELLVHIQNNHAGDVGEVGIHCNRCNLDLSYSSDEIELHDRGVHSNDVTDLVTVVKAASPEDERNESGETDEVNNDIIAAKYEPIEITDDIAHIDQEEADIITLNAENNHIKLPTVIKPTQNDNTSPSLTLSTHTVTSSTFSSTLPSSSVRKRKQPQRFRDSYTTTTTPAKKSYNNNDQSFLPLAEKNDVEIDISNLSSIRLRCGSGGGGGEGSSNSSETNREILNYLSIVDEKLDCIIKHFNVPFKSSLVKTNSSSSVENNNKQPQQSHHGSSAHSLNNRRRLNNNAYRRKSSGSSGSQSYSTMSSSASRTGLNDDNNDSLAFVNCDAPPEEITQYVISDELCEATYLKSRNRGNFSKNLVYAAFPLDERVGRNCYGRRGGALSGPKEPLECAKLEAVREAVFKKFPVMDGEDEEVVWKKECVIAIDTALRSEMRTRILNLQMRETYKTSSLMNMPM